MNALLNTKLFFLGQQRQHLFLQCYYLCDSVRVSKIELRIVSGIVGMKTQLILKKNKCHVNLSLRKEYACEDEPGSGRSSL